MSYVRVDAPDHPFADSRGRIYEHRLVVERMLGRYLRVGEVVHHINGNTCDNRPENLVLFATQGEHIRHHQVGRRYIENCSACGGPADDLTRGCQTCRRRHKFRRRRERERSMA